jgi:aminoglycoside 3-N-acetyltransferase
MDIKHHSVQSMRLIVTKHQLIDDLKKLGIQKGDHVAVALSLKKIGYLQGGPNEFIDALAEVVGPTGTIMMNTFTHFFPLSSISTNYVFDGKTAKTYTGIVPETFRRRKGVRRSKHPMCSVAAYGKYEEFLIEAHEKSVDSYIPYSRLAEIGGKFLCIGIGHNLVALRHEAQFRAGLLNLLPFYSGVQYKTNQGEVRLFVNHFPPCVKKLSRLVPDLINFGILKSGTVGKAQAYVGWAKELINSMARVLREHPELNLCDDVLCIWCRELERKLYLFNKIESPAFFQRNAAMLKLISLFNQVRLARYRVLRLKKDKGKSEKSNYGRLRIAIQFLKDTPLALKERL